MIFNKVSWIFIKCRWLSQLYAFVFGYFWLPCPICGNKFGGHEWLYGHTLMQNVYQGMGVCYRKECLVIALERNQKYFEKHYEILKKSIEEG